ncbi:formyltetrahydrofolate deformylase [PVC group bacterium (ex Bugula neritina AB1)]|nr:formyltetrahydrofolate deformylase [PVC group bacterium (ex Bugula neritina AB1)]
MKKFVLLFCCPDQVGIVARISSIFFQNGCNILESDQYRAQESRPHFFLRVVFSVESEGYDNKGMQQHFSECAAAFSAHWILRDLGIPLKTAIFLSKDDHCLSEILYLWSNREIFLEINCLVSNHSHHKSLAERYGIPFHHIASDDKKMAEENILKLTKSCTDFLILARYMQILSEDFLEKYQKDLINIHHSFLPSFIGRNPYQKAFDRGVKMIGATAHFVTKDLDEGPIITQSVKSVSHRDTVEDMKNKGRILERDTLTEAIRYYAEGKIMKYQNKTIVFS